MKKRISYPWTVALVVLFVLGIFAASTAFEPRHVDAAGSNYLTGLQFRDSGIGCSSGAASPPQKYTTDLGVWTPWIGDSDNYDPDCMKLFAGDHYVFTPDLDIRIGIQARDVNTPCGFLWLFKCGDGGGTVVYGPWLSDVGGTSTATDDTHRWSGWATDADAWDPDQWRITVDTRQRYGYSVQDFKLGVQLADISAWSGGCNPNDQRSDTYYTASSSAAGGWTVGGQSGWVTDADYTSGDYDGQNFNCMRINLLATTTLNDPTAALTGTSSVPVNTSVNIPWDVEYINTSTGCTLAGRYVDDNTVADASTTILVNGTGSKISAAITEPITYFLYCVGFKSGTAVLASNTITPYSGAAPTIDFEMKPTSGLSAGGTATATIAVVNTTATALSCTLKGYDAAYAVVDAGYAFTVSAPSAIITSPVIQETINLTSGTSWVVPYDWNAGNNSIELWGGGGGGGGDGSGSTGTAGTATVFNTSLSAGGGGGGASGSSGTPGGTGGTASGGNTTNTNGIAGTAGTATTGGAGGTSPSGGAGGATISTNSVGNSGVIPGGGGSGGCSGCSGTGAAGGGSGAYVKSVNVALTPGTLITYSIGTGGAGGTGTRAGGAGGAGKVVIKYTHGAPAATIYLTSGTTWTVPSDWSSQNSIEVIGGGGGGGRGATKGGGGGGGGAYTLAANVTLTPGAQVTYAVGAGGAGGIAGSALQTVGGDSYICNSQSNCASIGGTAVVAGAKGGGVSTVAGQGGLGGDEAAGVPSLGGIRNSGGDGGLSANWGASGGGGAAGPLGDGAIGGAQSGSGNVGGSGGGSNGGGSNGDSASSYGNSNGGNNAAGTGGGSGSQSCRGADGTNGGGGGGGGGYATTDSCANPNRHTGGNGGNGTEWDSTHGSGGGGGGAGVSNTSATDVHNGGAGGLYGAGGGGGSHGSSANANGGNGAQGIIVIKYIPRPISPMATYITNTAQTTWTVPNDWSTTNTIEVIGGGGGGADNAAGRGGAGGGAYSKTSITAALTPGSTITIKVGTGGTAGVAGGDTYFNASSVAACVAAGATVCAGAKGGSAGGASTGAGGQSSAGVGSLKYSGGTGGDSSGSSDGGGGGGGAAGPLGAGANGGNTSDAEGGGGGGNSGGYSGVQGHYDPDNCLLGCGGRGGYNDGSSGAGSKGNNGGGGSGSNGGGGGGGDDNSGGRWNGGAGGAGIDINGIIGSGGGGGGGGEGSGGGGGLYGGGGGGGPSAGGTGGQGVIIITYTPATSATADNTSAQTSAHSVNVTTNFVVACTPSGGGTSVYATSTVTLADCSLDGITVPNGSPGINFYSAQTPPTGQTCDDIKALRGCTAGALTGSATYQYGSCSVQDTVVITANGKTNSTAVRKGASSVAIEWDGGNADSCTISSSNGSVSSTDVVGSASTTVSQKTIYQATCTKNGNTATSQVIVNILPSVIEI